MRVATWRADEERKRAKESEEGKRRRSSREGAFVGVEGAEEGEAKVEWSILLDAAQASELNTEKAPNPNLSDQRQRPTLLSRPNMATWDGSAYVIALAFCRSRFGSPAARARKSSAHDAPNRS